MSHHIGAVENRSRRPGQLHARSGEAMHVVVRTNDPVRLSFLVALLQDAGITPIILDTHASAVEGSIGAIPRRLAVPQADRAAAMRILREAGEAAWT